MTVLDEKYGIARPAEALKRLNEQPSLQGAPQETEVYGLKCYGYGYGICFASSTDGDTPDIFITS
jgi:hypothetical protein